MVKIELEKQPYYKTVNLLFQDEVRVYVDT